MSARSEMVAAVLDAISGDGDSLAQRLTPDSVLLELFDDDPSPTTGAAVVAALGGGSLVTRSVEDVEAPQVVGPLAFCRLTIVDKFPPVQGPGGETLQMAPARILSCLIVVSGD